jgi:hypothetical protein
LYNPGDIVDDLLQPGHAVEVHELILQSAQLHYFLGKFAIEDGKANLRKFLLAHLIEVFHTELYVPGLLGDHHDLEGLELSVVDVVVANILGDILDLGEHLGVLRDKIFEEHLDITSRLRL